MKSTVFIVALFFSVVLLPTSVQAVEDGGPKTLSGGTTQLVKNGFGNREKMFLSLYEGSLYLKQKSRDAAAIIEADEAMAVRIKITSRFVSQQKLVSALEEGFKSASGGDTSNIDTGIQQFRACFSEAIKLNDEFILAYNPGNGVTVYKNKKKKGVVGDLPFKKAMFGIWLGDNSVDQGLKNGLLGQ